MPDWMFVPFFVSWACASALPFFEGLPVRIRFFASSSC